MHIPDGFLTPTTCVVMYLISLAFLVWSWKKVRLNYPKSFIPIIAVSSAFIFAAQMINFPIVLGTSGHLVGGTFLAILLGPYAAILSMTIVLSMQAIFFADGGMFTFGANIFNMAIIGGLSFYIVKILSENSMSRLKLFGSVFIASWLSVIFGAVACGIEIGFSPMFESVGGVSVTVPSMLFWHLLIGLGEGAITATLVSQLDRVQPAILSGLAILRRQKL